MWKTRILALAFLIIGAGLAYFIYASIPSLNEGKTVYGQTTAEKFPFKLGLDLSGGVQLVYQADVSSIKPAEVKNAMDSLRDVVERRINLFGVAEPIVQIEEKGGVAGAVEERLIVELPGITDVKRAVEMIGQTPKLEFMTERSAKEIEAYNKALEKFNADQEAGKPLVVPPELFAKLTKENVNKTIAIFLDRDLGNTEPISAPVVREEITGGKAQITGKFTAAEAKTLVGRLNSGALPVDKLELLSTQTISAPLGAKALNAGVWAGIWGLVVVAGFLILWYRLPGVVAAVALAIYTVIMLILFKLFAKLTKENVNKTIAIFLDRDLGNTEPISAPV
ncbi:MAG: Preprotein translocase subunit SecD, partial [Candidatus Azambacteria bacterium GW2011_GWA1_44_9]